jgi:pimeloyl-ACP methyl ester carboxylesterase
MPFSSLPLHNAFRHSVLLAACIGACLFTAQSTAAYFLADSVIEFQRTDCWVKPDSKAETDCGWLTVPEDWDHPNAQKLKLPVVIYRPLNPDPSLHPVIYLSGGPGYPALGYKGEAIRFWRREADNFFPGRALILFDQRGTGLGSPKLECRDGDGPMVWYPVSKNPEDFGDVPSRVHAAYAACAARHLAAGRQLSAFNTVQSAADVDALRRVLKLKSVVLFGISYGTRLALTVMKLYPKNIHAAILDSVYPPQAAHSAVDSRTFGAVLDRLFQACHQDERCAVAYPNLRDQLLRVLEQLSKKPVIVEITNLTSSGPLYVRVDHRMFLRVLHHNMYQTVKLPELPFLISEVARGETVDLKYHLENIVYDHVGFPEGYDMGASLAVTCNDSVDGVNRRPRANDTESYPYLEDFAAWNREAYPCVIWPTKPGTGNHDVVSSEIPSLLLAGGLDASTTIEQAEMAAETLSQSHLFIFPASAHVQVRNKCSWKVIDEFLSDPANRPNPECLTSLRQPPFITLGKIDRL